MKLLSEINNLEVLDGDGRIFSIYSQKYIRREQIVDEVIKNVCTPMNWSKTISNLEKLGYKEFWDVSLDGKIDKITKLNKESHMNVFE